MFNPKQNKKESDLHITHLFSDCRGNRIRTCDPLLPKKSVRQKKGRPKKNPLLRGDFQDWEALGFPGFLGFG